MAPSAPILDPLAVDVCRHPHAVTIALDVPNDAPRFEAGAGLDGVPEKDVVETMAVENRREVRVDRVVREPARQQVLAVDVQVAALDTGVRCGEDLVHAPQAVQPVDRLRYEPVATDLVSRELAPVKQQSRDPSPRQEGGRARAPRAGPDDDHVVDVAAGTSRVGLLLRAHWAYHRLTAPELPDGSGFGTRFPT